MSHLTTHHLYPPFPADLPTASLESISLRNLQSQSSSESTNLLDSCRNLGFFYLNLLGSGLGESIIREAEQLHVLQQEFYALPHGDKDVYGMNGEGMDPFFSYRWTACGSDAAQVKDSWGRGGRREMYNVSSHVHALNDISPLYLNYSYVQLAPGG